MGRTDGVIGTLLALGGLGVVAWAWQLPPGSEKDPLGPRGFPTLLGLGLVACGLALVLAARRGRGGRPGDGLDPDGPDGPLAPGRLLGGIALTAVYVWSLDRLGYLIATPGFLAAMLVLQGGVGGRVFLWTTLGLPAALFLLFAGLMKVPLPLGWLERVVRGGS